MIASFRPASGQVVPKWGLQNVEHNTKKAGWGVKTYTPPQNSLVDPLRRNGSGILIFHRPAPDFPHVRPLLIAEGYPATSLGAVAAASIRGNGPPADGTGPQLARGAQHRLQPRVKGQYRLPEIAAIGSRPAFLQHIAGTAQGQTAIVPVIVGTPPRHQGSDSGLFFAGQFPLFHGLLSGQGHPAPATPCAVCCPSAWGLFCLLQGIPPFPQTGNRYSQSYRGGVQAVESGPGRSAQPPTPSAGRSSHT